MKNCPICDSEKTKKLLDWKTYTINGCKNCKLIFADPMPSDETLMEFYQGFMFKKPADFEIQKQIKIRKKELKNVFGIEKNPENKNKTFLDYGGGTGIVYQTAKELDLNVIYQDLDAQATTFVEENFGLKSEEFILNINDSEQKYDYIFSDNVIEHVKNPFEFTLDLYKKLKPEGTIIIKTPNASNTETFFNPMIFLRGYFYNAMKYNSWFKSFKACFQRFWHCDPPRHLYSFSEKSFKILCQKINIPKEEVEILFYDIPLFRNTISQHFFSKDRNLSGIKSIFIRLAAFPFVLVEIFLQIFKTILLKLKLLSPGGLILKISKK